MVAVDAQGWPIAWDVLLGNTADAEALAILLGRFRERFRIRRAVVVADRGMIGKATLALLRDHATAPFDYVLGCRMRRSREVAREVLARPGRYRAVAENLEVKEVRVGETRYIVCHNPIEARRDAAAREATLARPRETLERSGPKAVIGNRGYARLLTVAKGGVAIDEAALEREARLDGKFVLTTNTDLPAAEVAKAYKSLWRVERTFRDLKATLDLRPVYHQRDEAIHRRPHRRLLPRAAPRGRPTAPAGGARDRGVLAGPDARSRACAIGDPRRRRAALSAADRLRGPCAQGFPRRRCRHPARRHAARPGPRRRARSAARRTSQRVVTRIPSPA